MRNKMKFKKRELYNNVVTTRFTATELQKIKEICAVHNIQKPDLFRNLLNNYYDNEFKKEIKNYD